MILPNTITKFEIYNNPNLESVIFEGLDNLESVYIQCDACGAFNVNSFCEQLVNCGTLRDITLRNANLYITQDALNKLCRINKVSITGTIHIVLSAGETDLAAIDFNTKKLLVERFGDFTVGNKPSGNSKIAFNYKEEEVSGIDCEHEVKLFSKTYPALVANPFGLKIGSGNRIAITTNSQGVPVLNIKYTINNTTYATIDQFTGDVTLKPAAATAGTNTSKVTITVTVTRPNGSNTTIVTTSDISFTWQAPKVGDFVYANGDYSANYTNAKNCIGIVYAVQGTDSGTAYVLGKEFVSTTN